MCCLRMGRLLTRVLLVALLMFAVMTFVISILGYRLRFFVLRMPDICRRLLRLVIAFWGRILSLRWRLAFALSGIA